MYNENTKNQFISELQSGDTIESYKSVFNRAEKFETQLNKDIFSLDLKECNDLLSELNPKSVNQISVLKSLFSKYTDWAILANLADKNNWVSVPIDESLTKDSFKDRYVKNLDELINVANMGLGSWYDKCILYLLYMGIMGNQHYEEITHLLDDDVKVGQKMINTNRRIFNIIDPLYDLIQKHEHFEESKRRDENSIYFIKPFIKRGREGQPININYIFHLFRRLQENIFEATKEKKNYSATTIWRSGLFYSLYQLEQTNGSLTYADYVNVGEVFGKEMINFSLLSRDYETYKKVFWSNEEK